jgi:serine/threonine-protein kinase
MSEAERSGSGGERYCPACDKSFFGRSDDVCPNDGTRLVRIGEDPLLGRELDGRFTIKERLGTGGMGSVYRAWQRSVGREVAVKVIRGHASHDKDTARRFLREAKLASRLSQPNVVSIHDFGQSEDGLLYIAMELCTGRTLAQVLAADRAFSPERTVHIALQLCDALAAAHALEIVHRDLKPSNVIVLDEPRGRDLVKVLDFGLARSLAGDHSTVTQSDALLGTPTHMAPEMAMGAPTDERADLYALGVILYELLAGRAPFHAHDARTLIAKHTDQAPPPLPPSVPASLQNVVFRLLEKNPERRYASAALTRDALVAALTSPSSSKTLPAPRPRSRALPVAALILALATAGTTLWLTLRKPTPPATTPEPESAPIRPPVELPAPTPSPPPAPARITLTLTSTPTSDVSVAGGKRMRTPATIDIDRSTTPIDVTFTRPSQPPITRRITPDHPQRVDARFPSRAAKPAAATEGFIVP